MKTTIEEQARAVSGCAAVAEHNARAAELNGFHGEHLEQVQRNAQTLRDAANTLKAVNQPQVKTP